MSDVKCFYFHFWFKDLERASSYNERACISKWSRSFTGWPGILSTVITAPCLRLQGHLCSLPCLLAYRLNCLSWWAQCRSAPFDWLQTQTHWICLCHKERAHNGPVLYFHLQDSRKSSFAVRCSCMCLSGSLLLLTGLELQVGWYRPTSHSTNLTTWFPSTLPALNWRMSKEECFIQKDAESAAISLVITSFHVPLRINSW